MEVLFWCVLIVLARITDVSIGTIRTIMMIQGRRALALTLAIFEILVWVFIVSRVITQLAEKPVYGVAYAIGFALGTFIGITLEQRLALGRQVVRIITRSGDEIARQLRADGLIVTEFDGRGRDGPVQELFIEVERRQTREVIRQARRLDSKCYYMVDDVRMASTEERAAQESGGWRGILKKK